MKRSEVFKSKYLVAADLGGKPAVLTIESAPLEPLKNGKGEEQDKTVLHFARTKKTMPLNMINWDSVAEIAGDDTDGWAGARIEVYPTTTTMGGKVVDCIRVRKPAELPLAVAPPKPASAPPKKPLADDMDDAIPF